WGSDSKNLEDALECNSLKTNGGSEWKSNPPTLALGTQPGRLLGNPSTGDPVLPAANWPSDPTNRAGDCKRAREGSRRARTASDAVHSGYTGQHFLSHQKERISRHGNHLNWHGLEPDAWEAQKALGKT